MVFQNKDTYLQYPVWQDVETLTSLRGYKQDVIDTLKTNAPLITAKQIHSNKVLIVSEPAAYECDGLITSKTNTYLGVFTADCLPIFIYEKRNKIIGILHAGKKGTQAGITREAILLLQKTFNSNSSDIALLFGPSICHRCYDYDLWENNIQQANELGVTDIINPELCTSENPGLFYSYHLNHTPDRMLSVIRAVLQKS